MASVSNTCNGSSGSKYTIRLYYVLNSQNISGNTSNITVYATLQRNDGYANSAYNGYENQNHTMLTVAGTKRVDKNFILDTRNSKVQELSRWTGNISHNADGTKTIALAASFTSAMSSLTGGSVSTNWTLPAIPRVSDFNLIPDTVDAGQLMKIQVLDSSRTLAHTVTITLGSYKQVIEYAPGDVSHDFRPPPDWCNAIPNATSAAATVTVTTKSGSTVLGSKSKTLTIRVPSIIVPSAGTLSVTRVDGAVPSGWGIYVQGYSKATVKLTGAAGSYGSTIKSYSLSGGGYSSASSSFTTGVLKTAGTVSFTGKVTDSRGRTATATQSITVQAYSPPRFGTVNIYRCNAAGAEDSTGGYVAIQASYSYTSLSGKNTCSGSYRLARVGGGGSALTGSFSSGTKVIVPGIDGDYSWSVTLTLKDALNTMTYNTEVSTAATTMDFLEGGKGVAVGKVAEQENLLDVAFDARFRGKVAFDAPAAVLADLGIDDHIVDAGSNGNGRYIKYNSGRMVCDQRDEIGTVSWTTRSDLQYASISWTFPASFADLPQVYTAIQSNGFVWTAAAGPARTSTDIRMISFGGTTPAGMVLNGLAIGRWK